MPANYATILAKIEGILNDPALSRAIDIRKLSQTPNNTSEPWKGPPAWDDDDIADGANVLRDVRAIFVGAGQVARDFVPGSTGDFFRESDGFLVAGSAASDLNTYDQIKDGDQLLNVVRCKELKPGDTILLWMIEVEN